MSENKPTEEVLISNNASNHPQHKITTVDNYDLDDETVQFDNKTMENINEEQRTFKERWFGPLTEGGVRVSTMTATAMTFGTGCMTFPYIIGQVGVVPGVVIFLLVSFSMLYTLDLLLKGSLNANTFNFGELTQKSLNNGGFIVYNVSTIIFLIGAVMTYQLTSYQFFMDIFAQYFYIQGQLLPLKWRYAIIITVSCFVIQVPLCLYEKMSRLKYTPIIATCAIIIIMLIIFIVFLFHIDFSSDDIKWFIGEGLNGDFWSKISVITNAFVVFMFGYLNHNGFLLVMKNLQNPTEKRTTKVMRRSFWIEFIVYFVLALSGYFLTPSNTNEMFLNTRLRVSGTALEYYFGVAKVIMVLCLQSLIPLRWSLLKESLFSFFKDNQINKTADTIITVVMLIIMNYSLLFVDNVVNIIGFVGGIFGVLVCYFIPLFIYIGIFGKKKVKSIIGYILLIFFGIIGVISTIFSLIKAFKGNSAPS